jgi:protein O-GlcNAc transferase
MSTVDRKVSQAIASIQQGKPQAAVTALKKTIAHAPNHIDARYALGIAEGMLGHESEAMACFRQVLELQPAHGWAHFNLGAALFDAGHIEEALHHQLRSVDLLAHSPEARINLVKTLNTAKQHGDALAHSTTATTLAPNSHLAWACHGATLCSLKRFRQAQAALDRALHLDNTHHSVWSNQSEAFLALGHLQEAQFCMDQAIALEPTDPEYWGCRGTIHRLRNAPELALQDLEHALTLPANAADTARRGMILGEFLYVKASLCDWSGVSPRLAELKAALESEQRACNPWLLQHLGFDHALLTTVTQGVAAEMAEMAKAISLPRIRSHSTNRVEARHRIRIGYFSSDFRNHPVGQLTQKLFEHHDKSKFEIVGFFLTPPGNHPITHNIQSQMDHWLVLHGMSNEEALDQIAQQNLDIAIDLNGYTRDNRLDLFVHRLAPIQATWLGYPGTTELPGMDYVIADQHVLPTEHAQHCSEKPVWLPHSFFMAPDIQTAPKVHHTDRPRMRAEQKLPVEGLVLSCFNAPYKIDPHTFATWMRLLHKLPQATLWLSHMNEAAKNNLRQSAAQMGIVVDRIVFAEFAQSPEDHLRRIAVADLFLDTFFYNAHTTAAESLMMGVPVITREGQAFASRVASSLLQALDMPELVTKSTQEYEDLIVTLASNNTKRIDVCEKLQQGISTKPLFDLKRTARNIERAYSGMWSRHQQGLPPEQLLIQE